jgi:hypothetical protein
MEALILLEAAVAERLAPHFSRIETLRDVLPSMAVLDETPTEAGWGP